MLVAVLKIFDDSFSWYTQWSGEVVQAFIDILISCLRCEALWLAFFVSFNFSFGLASLKH